MGRVKLIIPSDFFTFVHFLFEGGKLHLMREEMLSFSEIQSMVLTARIVLLMAV
jgi:hypothetical protein